MFQTRRLVYLSLFLAMATALHVLEGLFPIPLPLPGVKLGLANIVTLLVLSLSDLRAGLTVALARVFLGSLLGGVFLSPAFLLGLTGAICSTLVMVLLLRHTRCFSLMGISLAGAVGHNVGQLLMAALILQNQAIFYYLPFLLLFAIPSGLLTGTILQRLLQRLEGSGVLPQLTGKCS
jgi:heptaprenyl diphosphate synthase